MLVMKFGGTSVGSGERIVRVAEIVVAQIERQPVVVTSAMTGITDALLAIADAAAQGDAEACQARFAALQQRHWEAANAIDEHGDWSYLRDRLVGLGDDIDAALKARQNTPALRDSIACWGELLAVILVARAIERQGTPSCQWDEPLIATDNLYTEATPDLAKTQELARLALANADAQGAVLVCPGFVGQAVGYPDPFPQERDFLQQIINYTTLGRGGSDYSATLLAAALGADACWIYTDVDGVFTADPRVVPQAQVLPVVSFATAGRLAMSGAKVLHPRSVAPAARYGFELRVRNTFHPEREGTFLVAEAPEMEGMPLAVAGRRKLVALTLRGPGLPEIPNLFGRMCQAVAEVGAELVLAAQPVPGHDPQVIIDESMAGSVETRLVQEFAKEQRLGQISAIATRSGLALCTIVGDGLPPMCLAQMQRALAAEKIIPLSQSAAPEALTVIIEATQLDRALRRLHLDLIEPALREVAARHQRPYADGQWAAGGRPEQRRRFTPPQH
jgi:aspartate kinase